MPTPAHVEALLTHVGIPKEDVSKISALSDEEVKTFDFMPYAEKVKNNYQTQFQNDPEFFKDLTVEKLPPEVKKRLESTQFARASNIVRDKFVKGLGMTEADYADLPDEQKEKIELLIPAIAEKYTKSKAGDKQLQADLIEARKKLEAFDGYEEKTKTKYEGEANQKVAAAIFNAALIGELSAIPGLKIAAGDIAATASAQLLGKYGFERVGDYAIELRQKANPQMKVLKNGSSQELTLKDALLEIATERGWVEVKKDDGKGNGVITVTPNGKGALEMVPPHLKSHFSKKIESEK